LSESGVTFKVVSNCPAEIEAMNLSRNNQQQQPNSVNSSVHEHVPGNSSMSDIEDKMRRKLRFFFMNPIEKWEAKRRFPYKFITQLVKILLVTFQVCQNLREKQ
jgi:hypothetical protein